MLAIDKGCDFCLCRHIYKWATKCTNNLVTTKLSFKLLKFLSIKVLAHILYNAAEEGGYVDPYKVEEILGVPNPKKASSSVTEETVTG